MKIFIKADCLIVWLYSKKVDNKIITKKEELMMKYFSYRRKEEFMNSRSYLRISLAEIFNLDPLDIPIDAKPGKPPKLPNNYGFISLSHCKEAFLIAWSKDQIGIDIENKNRRVNPNLISKYLSLNIKNNNSKISLNKEELNEKFLEYWVIKESLIKWQNGNFFFDFKKWELDQKNSIAIHLDHNFRVKTNISEFQKWKIGIASNLL